MNASERILNVLSDALKNAPNGAECDILYMGECSGMTRFTQSAIHQNMVEDNANITIRVILDGRVGVATTNEAEPESLKAALRSAEQIALNQKRIENLPPLPEPAPVESMNTFNQRTADFGPLDRAMVLETLFEKASQKDVTLSGAFSTSGGLIAVVNTNGVKLAQPITSANLNVLAFTETSSGYARGVGRSVNEFSPDQLAETAIQKSLMSAEPHDIDPGEYDVLLEPDAVGDLFEWLTYIGLGAKEFQEGTSFMSEKIGQQIVGDNVTLCDNALDPRGITFPFDCEGVPKQKVFLFENGVARGVVYDRQTAAREKRLSTGHSLGAEYPNHPIATSLVFEPGDVPEREMLGRLGRGLLITRFHYINGFLDTRKAVLTGMTRDGTFWVEDGKIQHGVKNLRFSDSMLRAFSNVAAISREAKKISAGFDSLGAFVVPSIVIRGFRFVSGTDH